VTAFTGRSVDCDAKEPAKEEKVIAQVITKSVKIDKKQKISVKADVPDSFYKITLSVRQKTKAGNIAWIKSEPITGLPSGKSVSIDGIFNLSNVAANPGQTLQVRVEITDRPGVEPRVVEGDKEIAISTASASG